MHDYYVIFDKHRQLRIKSLNKKATCRAKGTRQINDSTRLHGREAPHLLQTVLGTRGISLSLGQRDEEHADRRSRRFRGRAGLWWATRGRSQAFRARPLLPVPASSLTLPWPTAAPAPGAEHSRPSGTPQPDPCLPRAVGLINFCSELGVGLLVRARAAAGSRGKREPKRT